MRIFARSTATRVMGDRRLVSMRQQSEIQKSIVGEKSICASSETVF